MHLMSLSENETGMSSKQLLAEVLSVTQLSCTILIQFKFNRVKDDITALWKDIFEMVSKAQFTQVICESSVIGLPMCTEGHKSTFLEEGMSCILFSMNPRFIIIYLGGSHHLDLIWYCYEFNLYWANLLPSQFLQEFLCAVISPGKWRNNFNMLQKIFIHFTLGKGQWDSGKRLKTQASSLTHHRVAGGLE